MSEVFLRVIGCLNKVPRFAGFCDGMDRSSRLYDDLRLKRAEQDSLRLALVAEFSVEVTDAEFDGWHNLGDIARWASCQ
jgi:hypothetical protein